MSLSGHEGAGIALAECLSRAFLLYHRICPLHELPSGELSVAVAEGFIDAGLDDIAIAYARTPKIEPVSQSELEAHIERLTATSDREIELSRSNLSEDDGVDADLRNLANEAPVVRYVNLLVRDAHDLGASDIHLESTRNGLETRFRLDGVLTAANEAPTGMHHAVISRIKLLAELDIAERRRPQDGRIRVRMDSGEVDLRVSTVPSLHGESVVLRLLDLGGQTIALEELGMPANIYQQFTAMVAKPHGLLLVTGPTGSGKTTTLYSALARRNAATEKIITVEEPVEYHVSGVTQVPVHRQAGVTFATALRAILRQDPDVVMIGEMRDSETADIGIQAALTGHLVLSTLHTNDALSAIPRLIDLGAESFLVAATLDGILAQRLVRRTCPDCLSPYVPSAPILKMLGDDAAVPLVRGAGCVSCRGTGFRGRIGVFEYVPISDALRDAISRRAPHAQLRELVEDTPFRSMREDGWNKARHGLTTLEEVVRVVDA